MLPGTLKLGFYPVCQVLVITIVCVSVNISQKQHSVNSLGEHSTKTQHSFFISPSKYYTQWNSKCAPKITAHFGDNDSYITLHSQQIRRTSDSEVDTASKAAKEFVPQNSQRIVTQSQTHEQSAVDEQHDIRIDVQLFHSSICCFHCLRPLYSLWFHIKALNMIWFQYYNNMFITFIAITDF